MASNRSRYRDSLRRESLRLKRKMKVYVFGPYWGPCYGYLEEITDYLRKAGYDRAKLVSEEVEFARPRPGETDEQFYWRKSKMCMKESDVCIFIFFQTRGRPELEEANSRWLNEGPLSELGTFIDDIEIDTNSGKAFFDFEAFECASSMTKGKITSSGMDCDWANSGSPILSMKTLKEWVAAFCEKRYSQLKRELEHRPS